MTDYPYPSDVFRRKLLHGLYADAERGRGTDLEVIVPSSADIDCEEKRSGMESRGGDVATERFHLHLAIVAASSRYFATFPEPKIGRVLNDLDSESFAICVRFMYTGEYWKELSHENVASILHAADILQIDGLKQYCIDYLENSLDYSNHEQVIQLADQFGSPELKSSALCFQSANSSRDALMAKRETLVKELGVAKRSKSNFSELEVKLKSQLDEIEKQLREIFVREREQVLSSRWYNDISGKNGDDAIPFSLGCFRKPGAVGHFVNSEVYEGSSTYGVNTKLGMHSNGSDYPFYNKPTPPPTKEQYEKYGIVHAHDTLIAAIDKAKPGDRIYLAPGTHNFELPYDDMDQGYLVEQAQEFIGLGKENEVIIETKYDVRSNYNQCFRVLAGPVGFYNITFKVKGYASTSQCSGDDPFISIAEEDDNGQYDNPTENFLVKNCQFDLGCDCNTAFPTRVSGIFIKRAKQVTIEGCKFIGGAGSAIVALNDPYWHCPSIEIVGNTFFNTGQPTFSESSSPDTTEDTPGPSSVELWKLNRRCCEIKRQGCEKHKILSIKMEENHFKSNLRAPIAYRSLNIKPFCEKANDCQLYTNLPVGEDLNVLVHGFDLISIGNVLKSNGLQFDKKAICRMLYNEEKKQKKICTDKQQHGCIAFPDGDSLLVIEQTISDNNKASFPPCWADGEPFVGFRKEYGAVHDDDDDDDDYYDDDDDDECDYSYLEFASNMGW